MKTISVTEDLYVRLERLAIPFVDHEPADVVGRLVDSALQESGAAPRENVPSLNGTSAALDDRSPRERGGVFTLAGERIVADSVRDLYEQVLEYIQNAGLWTELVALAPYKTSSQRYLISTRPVHPNGKDFFVPVSRGNLFMESHKNYRLAIKQLQQLLAKIGIQFEYGGGA